MRPYAHRHDRQQRHTSIGNDAFGQCGSLTNVTFGSSVTSIGDGAFAGTSLTSVTIPNSVTSIGDWAFSYCTGLTSVTMPDSVTSIGDGAFYGCASLNNITLPDSVTSIGVSAFRGCSSLTSVTIPNSVASIGAYTFGMCSSLTSITIGNSVASMGDQTLYGCSSLTGVYFLGDAPSVGESVFYYAPATIYHLPGTTGWGPTFGDRPTAPWVLPQPLILGYGGSFGVQTNRFGFIISWATNLSVVVQACTDPAHPTWSAVGTNSLTTGSSYFSDSEWTNYPARFYRLRSP